MFGGAIGEVIGHTHPFGFIFQNLADGASLDLEYGGDILLPCIGVLVLVETDFFPSLVVKALFLLLCPWGGHGVG